MQRNPSDPGLESETKRMLRLCVSCETNLERSSFSFSKSSKDLLNPKCRACCAAAHQKRRLAGKVPPKNEKQKLEDRARMKQREQTREYKQAAAKKYKEKKEASATRPRPEICEVCRRPPRGMGSLHWDHCHATGMFRGWLCTKCNMALGHCDDQPEILLALVRYLYANGTPQTSPKDLWVSKEFLTAETGIPSPLD